MTDSSTTTSPKSGSKSKSGGKSDSGGKSKSGGKSDSGGKTDSGSKSDSGATPKDSSAGYVRGENQKPVTEAYRDNWRQIFGNKMKSAKKSGRKRR